MKSTRLFLTVVAATALALTVRSPVQADQRASNTARETYRAFAVNLSNLNVPAASQVDIVIDRWTSDVQSAKLTEIFQKQGPKALLNALQDQPAVGSIRTPGALAYDLRYARQLPGEDGGRRIILGTDRPIGFFEATSGSRSLDYPFTVIEMRVDNQGRGEGKLSVATKLILNDNVLVLENYADQPVMLKNIEKQR